MRAPTLTLTLAMVALAAGTLLLTGCEPVNTTGSTGSTGTSDGLGVDCDPTGFGPLSGCDGTDGPGSQEGSSETTKDNPVPGKDVAPDDTTEAEPAPCEDDSHNLDSGAGIFDEAGKNDCDGTGDGDHGQTWDQQTTETTMGRYTVTLTWVVVSIKFTGFRECVLGLREATAKSEDHFSRRVTTTEDCKAQQVDAVYRPVASTGK